MNQCVTQGEVIVLCSAPADVKYALAIREMHPNTRCSIVVIQLEEMAVFLRSLTLPDRTDIDFIPYPAHLFGVRRVWNNFRIRKYLDGVKREHFGGTKGCRVFFFAPYMDWVLFSLLAYLKTGNTLCYVSYLPLAEDTVPVLSVTYRKMQFWMSWATRTDILFRRYKKILVPVWMDFHNITHICSPGYDAVAAKYAYTASSRSNRSRSILLFPGCEELTTDLRGVTESLVKRLLETGIEIVVKAHPRLGLPKWLEEMGFPQIPKFIPSEFLNINDFFGIIGCESTALAVAAKQTQSPCVSMLHLLTYRTSSDADVYHEWLVSQGNGSVLFPKSMDELLELLDPRAAHGARQ